MKKDILVKIIITVLVFILLGCFVYTNYISKEKDLVFEARIKEVTVIDNVYTILVEEYDKKKKEYTCHRRGKNGKCAGRTSEW